MSAKPEDMTSGTEATVIGPEGGSSSPDPPTDSKSNVDSEEFGESAFQSLTASFGSEGESGVHDAGGRPKGWRAIHGTVRQLDVDKIEDYKDDIDTLLLFIGLFSAVLTAFVIASYPMLLPDKQDVAIQYLAQISAQTNTYTVTAGTVNSTVPSLSHSATSFKPSLAALRINYCWFASLIIALITASFSILVKQWLREYLAIEYTFPQQRLLARNFRFPGIATWKVYEIVGVLPLLLQLALGLFFLGLCFFTRSENHGIGTMCATFVGLWLFLYISVSIAPLTSARCPYNTPFLKPLMITLRSLIYRGNAIHEEKYYVDNYVVVREHDKARSAAKKARDAAKKVTMNDPNITRLADEDARLAKLTTEFKENANKTPMNHLGNTRVATDFEDAISDFKHANDAFKDANDHAKGNNENKKGDLVLLQDIDERLRNDDLLGTAMLDALTQSAISSNGIIKFVQNAIRLRTSPVRISSDEDNAITYVLDAKYLCRNKPSHRASVSSPDPVPSPDPAISTSIPVTSSKSSPDHITIQTDLLTLSRQVLIAISDIVAAAVQSEPSTTAESSVVQDSMYLLLWNTMHNSSSSRAIRPLLRCIQTATLPRVADTLIEMIPVVDANPAFRGLPGLLSNIGNRLHELLNHADSDLDPPTAIIKFVRKLQDGATSRPPPLTGVLNSRPIWSFSSDVLAAVINHLLKHDSEHVPGGSEITWLKDAISSLLSHGPTSLTRAGKKAIIGLCRSKTLCAHLGTAIQSLVRPNYEHYQDVLRSLGEVCKDITDEPSANLLLRTIARCFCTERCKHPTPFLAPLLAPHAFFDSEWTNQFSFILVERSNAILTADHDDWPPGSEESLRALMSLPIDSHQLNPDIPKVIFNLLCDTRSSPTVLRPLVSFDPEWRSRIVLGAAIDCIKAVVEKSDTTEFRGRVEFIFAMWDACDDYSYGWIRNSDDYEQIGTINPVRHLSVASRIHASPTIYTDNALLVHWVRYCKACAKAIGIFKTQKYVVLPAEEKEETARLAGECLDCFNQLEPAPEDLVQWEANFDSNERTTAFPDAIFQKLVEFAADADAAARKSWRIRRLRKSGVIPGGEIASFKAHKPVSGAEVAAGDGPEHVESALADEGGEGPTRAGSPSNATSEPVPPARETEGVAGVFQDDGREKPGTEVSKRSEIHLGSETLDLPTSTTQEGTALLGEDRAYPEAALPSSAEDVHRETSSRLVLPHSTGSSAHEIQGGGGAVSDGAREHTGSEGSSDDGRVSGTSSDPLGSSALGRDEMTSDHGTADATSGNRDDHTGYLSSASSSQEPSIQQGDASATRDLSQ